MNTNLECENTRWQAGVSTEATNLNPKRIKKIDRVIAALKLPGGLNRFEAERIGDHCLNSTIANVREMYGDKLWQEWETVPTRYCETGVRVLRYWLVEAS